MAARKDSAIARLKRNSGTGLSLPRMPHASLAVGRPAAGPCTLRVARRRHQLGFAGLGSLAIIGSNLYATASGQSAISNFTIGGG